MLVLGESHYSDADDPDLTRIVMKRLLEYKLGACGHESWMKTFTTFERAVAGRALSGEESIAFWNSTVFYNFIQQPLPYRGCRPAVGQFAHSSDAFDEVLNEYEPDFVIVWGVTLFDKISTHDGRGMLSVMSDTADVYAFEYTLRSGKDMPYDADAASRVVRLCMGAMARSDSEIYGLKHRVAVTVKRVSEIRRAPSCRFSDYRCYFAA